MGLGRAAGVPHKTRRGARGRRACAQDVEGLRGKQACAQDAEGAKRAARNAQRARRDLGGQWRCTQSTEGAGGGGGVKMAWGGVGVMAACCGWAVVWDSVWDVVACRTCVWWAVPHTYGLHCNPSLAVMIPAVVKAVRHQCGPGIMPPNDVYTNKMYPVCVAAFIVVCGDGGDLAVWACGGGDVSCVTCC
ncbi:hypothetical protein K439DRAFT_1620825 [Ramaria rubella]|nr:hypothetical protein K439DRAFT_1620825 [Ramaria rubella]